MVTLTPGDLVRVEDGHTAGGEVRSETGQVHLIAAGSILDSADGQTTITAPNVHLQALTGSIGEVDNALELDATNLDVFAKTGRADHGRQWRSERE